MVNVSSVGYFLPIFAFVLVFVVVYAFLKKSKVLGGNEPVMLFVSMILSGFFLIEANLVEFVAFASAWISVFIVLLFFAFVMIAMFAKDFKFLQSNWVSWTFFGCLIAFFIIASAHVFNWAINWAEVYVWLQSDWFGMILLLVIALAVSFIVSKKS